MSIWFGWMNALKQKNSDPKKCLIPFSAVITESQAWVNYEEQTFIF